MFSHITSTVTSFLLLAMFCCAPGLARADELGSPLVVPDQPGSIAMIECPDCDGGPFGLRVVTLSDLPDVATEHGVSEPDGPIRIATDILHPVSGELIHLNLVERWVRRHYWTTAESPIARQVTEVLANADPPVCRLCLLDAACEGIELQASTSTGRTACAVCGEPIIEIFIRFDPDERLDRGPRHYGVQITEGGVLDDDKGGTEGGNPGGSPDGGNPGGSPDGGKIGGKIGPPDGGNPGGSPTVDSEGG